jgi:hypothetical protein
LGNNLGMVAKIRIGRAGLNLLMKEKNQERKIPFLRRH